MTFGSLLSPDSKFSDYQTNAGDRGDSGSSYSYAATPIHWKSSKKSEKKQAAMSALTLIAFLFFLNILQTCLQEQTVETPITTVMLTRASANIYQAKHSPNDDEATAVPSAGNGENAAEGINAHTRKLLSVVDLPESNEEESPRASRNGKFIHNLNEKSVDWRNELTQVSDDDFARQQEKLDSMRKAWNKRKSSADDENRLVKFKKKTPTLEKEVDNLKQFINSPVMSDTKSIPKLSQYWLARRTTTEMPETKTMLFEEPKRKTADFNEFETFTKQNEFDLDNSLIQDKMHAMELRASPLIYVDEPVAEPLHSEESIMTPRNRRSNEQITTIPSQLFRAETIQIVTPSAPTIPASSTTKTYHVFTHPSQIFSRAWTTTTTDRPEVEPTDDIDLNEIRHRIDDIYFTTQTPMRYSNHHKKYHSNHRPHYRPPTRYRPPPNRRISDGPLVRQEYYPMSVVGQYGGDEESPVLGVLQLVWTLMSSFARPISLLLPQMAKLRSTERCLDLLACEAQRVGKYMGPTAEALATTLSTVLTWATPENEKKIIEEAVAAGRENSCFEQIQSCEGRSGGKSPMTVVAKFMEFRGRRDSRVPRS